MGRLLQLLVLGGNLSVTRMQLSVLLFYMGVTTAAIVKREAEAEASPEAEADPGYVRHGGYASTAPVCTLTPVKECVPRKVENPRKVCQTVFDIHEDTVVTETCEEVVRTVCTQTSEKASHHSHIVDKSTRLVEAGVPKALPHPAPVHGHSYGKREAEAEPEAEADSEADPYYGNYGRRGYGGYGRYGRYGGYGHGHVVAHAAPVKAVVAPPVCSSVPEKKCVNVPVSTPRKVARTVCDTVVDVTTIEDCHETVTKTCQQSHTKTSSHSAVVGHETKVVATAVPVATAVVHPGAAYHG